MVNNSGSEDLWLSATGAVVNGGRWPRIERHFLHFVPRLESRLPAKAASRTAVEDRIRGRFDTATYASSGRLRTKFSSIGNDAEIPIRDALDGALYSRIFLSEAVI